MIEKQFCVMDIRGNLSQAARWRSTVVKVTSHFNGRTQNLTHVYSKPFTPADPRCHCNEFGTKIDYNSAPVKDNGTLFAPTLLFSGSGYPMVSFKFVPLRPLLPWQLNVLIQTKLAAADIVTSHIIFSLHQLPLPAS